MRKSQPEFKQDLQRLLTRKIKMLSQKADAQRRLFLCYLIPMSFMTSPAMISPITEGTNAFEAGAGLP